MSNPVGLNSPGIHELEGRSRIGDADHSFSEGHPVPSGSRTTRSPSDLCNSRSKDLKKISRLSGRRSARPRANVKTVWNGGVGRPVRPDHGRGGARVGGQLRTKWHGPPQAVDPPPSSLDECFSVRRRPAHRSVHPPKGAPHPGRGGNAEVG